MHHSQIRRRTSAAFALVAATSLALSACSGKTTSTKSNASTPNGGGAITVATRNVAASLDPALVSDDPSFSYARAVYETLVSYSPTTRKYQPQLATNWEGSNDSKTFTFHLRKGVKFHDGSTMDAKGVIASLERTQKVGKGESFLLGGISGMQAPDADTLVIHLKSTDASFPAKLSQIFIMSSAAITAHASDADTWFGSHDAGSGPYKLVTWTPNNEIDLTKFADYWRGWSGKHADGYHLKVVDDTTQVLQLDQGTADIGDSLGLQDVKKKQADPSQFTVLSDGGLPFYLTFNLASPKLKNIAVREAIAKAIPYSDIINDVMLGFSKPLAGPVPSWMQDFDQSLKPTSTDPAGAKALLAAQGFTPNHPLTLTLMYFNGLDAERTIATIAQAALKTAGVNLKIEGAPWATLTAAVGNPSSRPDMGVVAMSVPTADPGSLLTGSFDPSQEGAWTYWGYNEPSTVSLLRSAARSADSSNQAAMYKQVQAALVQQYAAVWLMTYPDTLVARAAVKALVMDATDRAFDYWAAYKA